MRSNDVKCSISISRPTPHLQRQQNPRERFAPLDFELLNDCELPDREWLSGSDSDPAEDFQRLDLL